MLQQIFVDSQYADLVLQDGSYLFWLGDAIYVPQRHDLQIKVLNAWIPHTFYSVFAANDTLNLRYFPPGDPAGSPESIVLPHGNRSIDELLDYINPLLEYGYEARYDTPTNKLVFETAGDAELEVDPGTTSDRLLGVSAGDVSSGGVLEAPRGVDLTRTSSIFIRSNLHTKNRDPVTRRTGDILAKIPLTSQFNELEHFTSQAWVDCYNQQVSFLVMRLVDDNGRLLDLNGSRWTATIKLRLLKNDEPVPDPVSAFESERAAIAAGGQLGAATRDSGTKQRASTDGKRAG